MEKLVFVIFTYYWTQENGTVRTVQVIFNYNIVPDVLDAHFW